MTIPNSVTSIGEHAFYGCPLLKTVSIGSSMNSIGSEAFASCKNLETVFCHALLVPSAETDTFKDSYVAYATLYVPSSVMKSYKVTAPWSEFGKIEAIESTDVKNVEKKNDAKMKVIKRMDNGKVIIGNGSKAYDLSGKKVM